MLLFCMLSCREIAACAWSTSVYRNLLVLGALVGALTIASIVVHFDLQLYRIVLFDQVSLSIPTPQRLCPPVFTPERRTRCLLMCVSICPPEENTVQARVVLTPVWRRTPTGTWWLSLRSLGSIWISPSGRQSS